MIEERRIMMPVVKTCEVRYYIEGDFNFDLHFYIPPTPVVDKNDEVIYFDTRELAEKYIEENREKFFCMLTVKEEVIPME